MATYFRNVENNGVWDPGGTYTFEVYHQRSLVPTDLSGWPAAIDCDGVTGTMVYYWSPFSYYPCFKDVAAATAFAGTPAMSSKIGASYFVYPESTDMYLPVTASFLFGGPSTAERDAYTYDYTEWGTVTVTVPADTTPGTYGILYLKMSYSAHDEINASPYFTSTPVELYREILSIRVSMGNVANQTTTGSDNNKYICTDDHTETSSTVPITGSTWTDYWMPDDGDGDLGGDLGIRLMPFIYSAEIAYVEEFGYKYVRFYYDGALLSGLGTDIATPYLTADLPAIQYDQIADTQWLVHGSYAPRKVTRTSATAFACNAIAFTNGPFLKRNDLDAADGITMTCDVTAAAATGTLTASAAVFNTLHAGALFKLVHPKTAIRVSKTGAGTSDAITVKGDYTWTTSGAWTGKVWLQRNDNGAGWQNYRSKESKDNANIDLTKTESEDNIQYRIYVEAGLTGSDFVSDIVVHDPDNNGVVRIDSVDSSTSAQVTVMVALASTDATIRWAEGAWSAYRGYPRAFCFFENRAVYAGTEHNPSTVWLSKSDDYENFEEGVNAADSFAVFITTTNEIRWIAALKSLCVGTSGDEWVIQSNKLDTPITPTGSSFSVKQQTAYGSAPVQAVKVNKAILFLDYVRRKVREFTATDEYNSQYASPDLTALAEHITEGGLISIDHQRNPDSILWAVRDDGTLLSMSYEREQNVVAWARHPMDGRVTSCCIIPSSAEDEVWLSVARSINGTWKTCIERMKPRALTSLTNCFFVDCGKTVTNSTASATITGLTHLVGETVTVLGDGTVYTPTAAVTANGTVTISTAVTTAQVGLPFRYKLKPMRSDIQAAGGTTHGSIVKVAEMCVSFLNTMNAKYGVNYTNLYDFDWSNVRWTNNTDITGLFTGDVVVNVDGGFTMDNPLIISGNDPLPCTVRAIIPRQEKTGR